MAIKWKNNKDTTTTKEITLEKETKKKSWLGYLLVWMLVTAVSVITYRMEPELQQIRDKSQKELQEELSEQQGQNTTIDFGYYSDRDRMSLVSNIYYLKYKMENMYDGLSSSEYLLKNNKTYKNLTSAEEKKKYEEKAQELVNILYTVYRMDYSVGEGCSTYTYMYDKERGISNGQEDLAAVIQGKDLSQIQEKYQSYMVIDFDEKGNPSITTKYNVEESNFLNYLNNIKLQAVADYYTSQDIYIYEAETKESAMEETTVEEVAYEEEEYDEKYMEEEEGLPEEVPVETTVTENDTDTQQELSNGKIAIDFPKIKDTQVVIGFQYVVSGDVYYSLHYDDAFNLSYIIVLCFIVLLIIGALILQNISILGLKNQQIFRMPTEVILAVGFVGLLVCCEGELPYLFMMEVKEGLQYWFTDSDIIKEAEMINRLPSIINVGLWFAFYVIIYWGIANVLPYILHPIKNTAQNSIIIKIIKWIEKQCKKCYTYVTTIKVEKGLKNNIIKILAANFVLVSLFCCGWFLGILGVIIYTVILYFILMKKGGTMKAQYDRLFSMVTDMAQGELNVDVSENLGVFEPMKQELSKVRSGFKQAVEEEVKSQNMKTELITNVSHDLKTPLTAIITYVDLLKNENLDEETRKEYIVTLDKKSQRLKVLIEDLFEVSKASSNNITMHYADVDMVNLVKQVRLENEERIMDSDLIFRWNLPEEKCVLRLDPQRTYRVIENLLVNALKYSMGGSRVYVEVENTEKQVIFSMKNISATELNFEAEKLTERFVRGDVSRNTEGSGLGLAIARSFTEIQNGTFSVEIDGDLFKVTVIFNKQQTET